MTPPRVQLPALTAIRYFAAVHVVLFHVHCSAWPTLPRALETLRSHGYGAVALFYVLSGFILSHSCLGTDGRVAHVRHFWQARWARVYPLYLLALGWAAWHHVGRSGWDTPERLVASVLLLQAWWPQWVVGWNTPGWSISAEAFFYMVFPALALLFARWRRLAALLAVAAACVTVGALSTWLCWQGSVGNRPGQIDFWPLLAAFNPLLRLPEFAVGMVAGRIFTLYGQHVRPAWAVTMTLLGFGLSLAQAILPGPDLLHHGALLSPSFALMISGLACPNVISRVLAWRPLVVLGEVSYAVYILQDPLFDTFLPLDGEPFGRPHPFAVILRYLVALTCVAWLLHRLVERPLQRWLRVRPPRAEAAVQDDAAPPAAG